jgi:hypothetical protein
MKRRLGDAVSVVGKQLLRQINDLDDVWCREIGPARNLLTHLMAASRCAGSRENLPETLSAVRDSLGLLEHSLQFLALVQTNRR